MYFEQWYAELQALASKHGESVADAEAWREEFDHGVTAGEAFYYEYPEHAE